MSNTPDPRPQLIITQRENLIGPATLTAVGVKPVPANESVSYGSPQRSGAGTSTGVVRLTGAYSGPGDADLAVRINTGGTTARVSDVTSDKKGGGVLTALTVPTTIAAQDWTVVLKQRDADAVFASTVIAGLEVQMRVAGVNTGSITVARNLVQSAPIASLQLALSANQSESDDPSHDFGGAFYLDANGRYAPETLRLQFGEQPEVYRQHVEDRQGKNVFVISPPLVRPVGVGTPVYSVTGTYDATISDGTSIELRSGLTTQFDLLSALIDSDLMRIVDPLLPDESPGGVSAIDVDILSSAVLLDITLSGGDYMEDPTSVVLGPSILTGRYIAAHVGKNDSGLEKWDWRGPTGFLGTTLSGALFTGGGLTARIPFLEPFVEQAGADPRIVDQSFEALRNGLATWPQPCFVGDNGRGWIIGPALPTEGIELTLIWSQRPSEDCNCENAIFEGRLDPNCLGVTLEQTVASSGATMDPELKARLKLISAWLATSAGANQFIDDDIAEIFRSEKDVTLFERVSAVFATGLNAIVEATVVSSLTRIAAIAEWDTQWAGAQSDLTALVAFSHGHSLLTPFLVQDEPRKNSATSFPTSGVGFTGVDIRAGKIYSAFGHLYYTIRGANYDAADPIAQPASWLTGGAVFTTSDGVVLKHIGPAEGIVNDLHISTEADISAIARQYELNLFDSLVEAEIDPFDLAGSAGTGCWRDYETAQFFRVLTGDNRELGHLVPGRIWYSAVPGVDEQGRDVYIDTRELALHIKVGCESTLVIGDSFKVIVKGGVTTNIYQVGDSISFDTLAGRPVLLRGGVAGGPIRVFGVRGSVNGALVDYTLNVDSPSAYTDGAVPGFGFLITESGLPFQLLDSFFFSTSRGQYQTSINGGDTYGALADIPQAPVTGIAGFGGLSLEFVSGGGVSFSNGDVFPVEVEQPYSPLHAAVPSTDIYAVDGALDLVYDFGVDQPIELVAILSEGDLTYTLLDAADVALTTPALIAGGNDPSYALLPAPITARKIQFTAADLTGQNIEWLWCGSPFSVPQADTVTPRRSRFRTEGIGVNPTTRHIGLGYGIDLGWVIPGGSRSNNSLQRADILALRQLMDYLSENSTPLIVIPNRDYGDAFYVRWADDDLIDADLRRYQATDPDAQLLRTAIRFDPIYRC